MSVVVVYKSESEHRAPVETFLADLRRQTGHELDVVDPESRNGADFCQTYDIVEYPSLVALSSSGEVRQLWRGLPLPTISEVSYYA